MTFPGNKLPGYTLLGGAIKGVPAIGVEDAAVRVVVPC
jgi:hypothetical protein